MLEFKPDDKVVRTAESWHKVRKGEVYTVERDTGDGLFLRGHGNVSYYASGFALWAEPAPYVPPVTKQPEPSGAITLNYLKRRFAAAEELGQPVEQWEYAEAKARNL